MNAKLFSLPGAALPGGRGSTDGDHALGMGRLLQAVQELSLARSLPDIQRIIRTAARELTGCDGATFVLRERGKCYYAEEDTIAPLWKGRRFPVQACISGWVMLNRDAAVVPDIYHDPRIPSATYRPTFVKSLVMVPIRKRDPIGAIGNYWAHRHQPTEHEVALLQALADWTAVAMDNVKVYSEMEQRVRDRTAELEKANAEIRQLSVTDDLTRLNNRRGFYLLAEPVLRAAHHEGRSCLLAFLDVDELKRVNDTHGHDVGDNLIADVAEVLRTTLREADIVARMGGDEFCVLVTEPISDPEMLRKRLLDAFRRFSTVARRPYHLSVSIGLVQASATDAATVDELMARADELMYEEKKAKRASRHVG